MWEEVPTAAELVSGRTGVQALDSHLEYSAASLANNRKINSVSKCRRKKIHKNRNQCFLLSSLPSQYDFFSTNLCSMALQLASCHRFEWSKHFRNSEAPQQCDPFWEGWPKLAHKFKQSYWEKMRNDYIGHGGNAFRSKSSLSVYIQSTD